MGRIVELISEIDCLNPTQKGPRRSSAHRHDAQLIGLCLQQGPKWTAGFEWMLKPKDSVFDTSSAFLSNFGRVRGTLQNPVFASNRTSGFATSCSPTIVAPEVEDVPILGSSLRCGRRLVRDEAVSRSENQSHLAKATPLVRILSQ